MTSLVTPGAEKMSLSIDTKIGRWGPIKGEGPRDHVGARVRRWSNVAIARCADCSNAFVGSASPTPTGGERWKGREGLVRLRLIPDREGRDVIGGRLEGAVGVAAQRLHRDPQIAKEADRVRDVP